MLYFGNHVQFQQKQTFKLYFFLTDGIYVRVYEDRMDLLRSVIVGAYGTPYQDGLFFFDFHLPPEYPDVPPVRKKLILLFPNLLRLNNLLLLI